MSNDHPIYGSSENLMNISGAIRTLTIAAKDLGQAELAHSLNPRITPKEDVELFAKDLTDQIATLTALIMRTTASNFVKAAAQSRIERQKD